MSAVWKYFQVNESNKNKAECKLCAAKLSRGGTISTAYNTSNLIKHLKSQHDAEYKEFTRDTDKRQPTLQQTLAKREYSVSVSVSTEMQVLVHYSFWKKVVSVHP